ncbi:hypothetical protein PBI_PEREGRIN_235 [Rhodococcus phage Peregrin]|nr:hypothetical protein PBI_PEREGRIN_235 [Rhodococcus phage Peregrin]
MTSEFVVIENGQEVEWIDPVISVIENSECWVVDNGHYQYSVVKGPGRTMIIRTRDR